ncbi:MAG TPA: hypothetical protein DCR17_08695 [Verrucomicrobiales bacterium]|jgi:hypothetical protein|nr:hypothetical protein [Pedosphaera sp.]RZO73878.1 MAG: hypothetical protein EVA71_01050 [Limisphaerales bacterium]HAO66747.1 hypothetical protein [Verrucomicrobiales bacterium]HAQ98265.1 hypothetical protein [Verrucomicrobiales bacterium]HBP56458.1 hypothetical protein [Verrucomicrobiales bacterium]|tara:strand:- start:1036 stop:1677 length:642 start_codon:yes stop_codon:yes gene_type:complete
MRTKTLLIAAVLGAAGLASASAQVTSVNAVGYVNKDLAAGLNLVSNPLSNGGNAIGDVIPTAPSGSVVFAWNGAGYDSSQFVVIPGVLSGWQPADLSLPVGDGFFIQSAEATTITFVGEVLQGDDSNKDVPAGLSIQGSTVPVSGTMTDHGFPAGSGDVVFSWNGAGFDSAEYVVIPGVLEGWQPADPTLGVADAVFVDKAEGGAWDRNFSIN